MKKTTLTLLALIALSATLILKYRFEDHSNKEQLNKLHFKIAVSSPSQSHFSLKMEDADFSYNQIILNAVIGTLVKYGPSGRIEPYLAESWVVSNNDKTWTFKIRPGLTAENGDPINAHSYYKTLKNNLKKYSKKGSVIIFDHLIGWKNFINHKSDSLEGLSYSDHSITFAFDTPPDSFLELLRMPYFGHWINSAEEKPISTGPYKVKSIKPNEITLSLRDHWFTRTEQSVSEVNISFAEIGNMDFSHEKKTIIRLPFYIDTNSNKDFGYWIISPPTRLECFTLSPTKNNFFNNIHNRHVFNNKIRSQYPEMVKSNYFYQSAKSSIVSKLENNNYQTTSNVTPLTFALERANYSKNEIENLTKLIQFALDGTQIKFNIIERDLNDKNWFQKTDSNNYFDARISSVDIGASPLYAAIKMMFCTKLGVNFPDPSGNICNLLSNKSKTSQEIDSEFITSFNQILYDDSVILPIQHHSDKWFVTNDIDPITMPPTTLYPHFELIKTR